MSGYTRLSCLIWEWHRLNQLAPTTRLLWMALYTSPPAKRGVPALWHGSVVTMAEAARLPVEEAMRSLDTLLDHELAEYDPRALVLRLTELPDAGEWPSNPGILESWYKRFRMVPECRVRDAHVSTIRWMLERGALESDKNYGGRPSLKHEEAWKKTFGTIPIPAPRRRGVRKLSDDNDTGTEFQTSLFSSPVDKSDPNDFNIRETLPRGSGEGEGEGEGVLVSGSEIGPPLSMTCHPEPSGDRDLLEPLLKVFAQVYGGAWPLAPDAPERAVATDQVKRLPDLDYALLGQWMKSRGQSHVFGRELLSIPGRLIWAAGEVERWVAAVEEQRQRGRAMSAELQKSLAAVGLR